MSFKVGFKHKQKKKQSFSMTNYTALLKKKANKKKGSLNERKLSSTIVTNYYATQKVEALFMLNKTALKLNKV